MILRHFLEGTKPINLYNTSGISIFSFIGYHFFLFQKFVFTQQILGQTAILGFLYPLAFCG